MAPSRRPAARVRQTWFGFSWASALSLWNPPNQRLEKLGFPWIPSSESRLFNGLRGIFGEKKFSRPFSAQMSPAGAPTCGQEGQDCSWGELTVASDFQQEIVAEAVAFRPSQSKSNAHQVKTQSPPTGGDRYGRRAVLQGRLGNYRSPGESGSLAPDTCQSSRVNPPNAAD